MARTLTIGMTALWLCGLVSISGCASFGASLLSAERRNYNEALQATNDEQLLLNLVRLRYLDSTAFMEVGSITAQASFQSGLEAGRLAASVGSLPALFGITGNLSYVTQPTLVYTPLEGEEFARRLMTPLTLERLALLHHSGWGIERLFSLCVQEINGIDNGGRIQRPRPERIAEYRRFSRAMHLLGILDAREGIDLLAESPTEGPAREYMLRFAADASETPEAREIAGLLDIAPGHSHYRLRYPFAGSETPPDRKTFYIETRSLLGILYFLSHRVETPEPGGTEPTANSAWPGILELPFRVKSRPAQPDNAAVAVYYRGRWFYIDDRDRKSKSTFSLLTQLFALQSGAAPAAPPLLTLPAGR